MESKNKPLAHVKVYRKRVLKELLKAFFILAGWLCIGISIYHFIAHLSWIDSIYNASMIVGGMGPVNSLSSEIAKLFASVYAVVSGVILIGLFGLVFTPVLHRILHRLHIEE